MSEGAWKDYCPWVKLLPTSVVVNVATLGPLGTRFKAPGTIGSVAGVVGYTLLFHYAGPLAYLILLALFIYAAIGFCGEAEVRMRKRDPGEVILDEFVAIPVCFIGLQGVIAGLGGWAWTLLLAGFALFRLFDITKPFGISKLQDLPGGYGVVADDIAAAIVTCVLLHIGVIFLLPLAG
ncbi:phosphatidylglycerophosphatase A [Ruficoccus amylovorans]|uniref:Phosphatidylglycerophosphatase A n=1 Tax=Ruficoccus amylovorans TaxID=1804625 RepID=A0A842HJX2_9BACT|nr:phosphatidylglycerophosphatase A [Ruficoccus amylovorans]MBC2596420.1 phosphatidylglycerophosphatase A [Ruficoccus amylovorans]